MKTSGHRVRRVARSLLEMLFPKNLQLPTPTDDKIQMNCPLFDDILVQLKELRLNSSYASHYIINIFFCCIRLYHKNIQLKKT